MAERSPTPDLPPLPSSSENESTGDIGAIGMLKISSSPDVGTHAHSDFDPTSPPPHSQFNAWPCYKVQNQKT